MDDSPKDPKIARLPMAHKHKGKIMTVSIRHISGIGLLAIFALSAPLVADDEVSIELTPVEQLGKALFFDKISDPDWMSCADCHSPDIGWTGPIPGINKHGAVYRGAVPTRFGNRKPPSAAYATYSPIFYFDEDEDLFIGGNFWDGRATGERLGNPAADQALGPFLNPVEQNNPSKEAVCLQVAASKYASLFEEVWGPASLDCVTYAEMMYDQIGLSIAAYENSSEVNQFSSKYDAFLAGDAELSDEEALGLTLFEGKAMCSACHPTGTGSAFTDFTYDNLGVPRNPENPFYSMDTELLDDGTPINPLGSEWVDVGLGGFLQTRPEWQDKAAGNMGKHKVPTLRNIGKGLGQETPKAYGHNGYFKSLKSIVHFYNTRDTKPECPDPFTTEKAALQMNCWPVSEVAANKNTTELGSLGLTDAEEDALVAFMLTLSDDFKVKEKVK
ncbi:MAG: cytochrome c peroxidase [Gammaproteobacteria bacterium]